MIQCLANRLFLVSLFLRSYPSALCHFIYENNNSNFYCFFLYLELTTTTMNAGGGKKYIFLVNLFVLWFSFVLKSLSFFYFTLRLFIFEMCLFFIRHHVHIFTFSSSSAWIYPHLLYHHQNFFSLTSPTQRFALSFFLLLTFLL